MVKGNKPDPKYTEDEIMETLLELLEMEPWTVIFAENPELYPILAETYNNSILEKLEAKD